MVVEIGRDFVEWIHMAQDKYEYELHVLVSKVSNQLIKQTTK